MDGKSSAAQLRIIDDVVVHQRRGVNEFDHRGVENRAIALISAQSGRHEQDRRAHPFAAAGLNVTADLRNDVDLRLDMTDELAIHQLEVAADRFEDLRKRWGFFHAWLRLELYHGRKRR